MESDYLSYMGGGVFHVFCVIYYIFLFFKVSILWFYLCVSVYIYMCENVCVCVLVCARACGSHTRLLVSLELELQMAGSNLPLILGIELLCKSSKQSQLLRISTPVMVIVLHHLD